MPTEFVYHALAEDRLLCGVVKHMNSDQPNVEILILRIASSGHSDPFFRSGLLCHSDTHGLANAYGVRGDADYLVAGM